MNKFIKIIFVLIISFVIINNVFGISDANLDPNFKINVNNNVGVANNAIKRIWGTVSLTLQICAVAAVVFTGVRYMFATADRRADIKQQSIGLVVGSLLVFGAFTVIKFIINIVTDIT